MHYFVQGLREDIKRDVFLADPEEELPSATGQDLQPLGGVCGQPEERESTVEALQLPEWTGALPIKTYGKSRVPPIHICK